MSMHCGACDYEIWDKDGAWRDAGGNPTCGSSASGLHGPNEGQPGTNAPPLAAPLYQDPALLMLMLDDCRTVIAEQRRLIEDLKLSAFYSRSRNEAWFFGSEPAKLPFVGEGELPTRGYHGDAGFDLYVSEGMRIEPNSFVDVPCAVSVELPTGVWAMITGRSSTLRNKQLLVAQGIIDTGYRGELYAGVWNLDTSPVWIKEGDRLAQLILFPNLADCYRPEKVAELRPSERGEKRFGSSGQ